MYKMFAIVMIFVLVFSLMCVGVLADELVISPEKENTEVDPRPSSPQTGVETDIVLVAVLAVLTGSVAVYAAKKAKN